MSQIAPSADWLTSERSTARPTTPILVSDCAKVIRSVGGQIWLFQKIESGFLMRCTIERRQVRVLVPTLVPTSEPMTDEANSQLHVVESIDKLREWLLTVSQRL